MTEKARLLKNATASALQAVASGIVLFLLYRYLLETIGVDQLGIWANVLAITSVSRASELGLAGGVVKFVAKYRVQEEALAPRIVETALTSVAIAVGLILVAAYPILQKILEWVMPEQALPIAQSVLPLAMASLWLSSLTSVFQAGLGGCERYDLRCISQVSGHVSYLVFTFLLVPVLGISGVAYAQVAQTLLALTIAWALLRTELPQLRTVPVGWSKRLFNEMFRYGANLQVIWIAGAFLEPVTKSLMTTYGGLSATGYYEMASRMMRQLRTLLASANEVIIPVVAAYKEKSPEKVRKMYVSNVRWILFLSLPYFSVIVALLPLVSNLWIGHYEHDFVLFSSFLGLSWLINSLCAPAYFSYMGTGRLRWNAISHVLIGVLNAGLGWALGTLFGGHGVVIAWCIAVAAGGSIAAIAYHKEFRVPIDEVASMDSAWVLLASILSVLCVWWVYFRLFDQVGTLGTVVLCLLLYAIIHLFPVWRHPLRTQLTKNLLRGRRAGTE